ncbi:fungal-specific transcription factor domain-containing protein [Parasitella parasitica]|nr:fungal-specific transcription factor domain-containing protein [Parasitella parasitica]
MLYEQNYEPKTSSSKKRVRASQACVHCRKKKIKCDENRPDCGQCQEANVLCEYTEPKKRGPRKGYVQLLEERLAQMERKLMGPGVPNYNNSHQSHISDEENLSSPSTSNRAHSPIHLYENPVEQTSDLPPFDVVNHLVDLFFKYINSVFPFVHRHVLKRSIQDGSVSRPLLYSVLAIGARFSENPSIRTDPPYLAGERFAEKALSLVDADTLQPNLENIQFWGIMSCLEYGRASGSKSWVYGGLAVRFCQELSYYKEDTLSLPIVAEDGSIDTIAMALRRRVFWSCFGIDKLSCAGTRRPQCIDRSDCDANPPNISECLLLRDPMFHRNVDGKPIQDDSLMNIAKHYMRCVETYGEVNKFMNRAKSTSAAINWPPIAEFRNLDSQLRAWKDGLPEVFQFNQENLDHHCQFASYNYLNIWLSSHAVWCSSMMILHRISLAFSDVKPTDIIEKDLYRRIQSSIDTCRICVADAMGIFEAIKDLCGFNTLPYMGYSAYVFATVLMTSTFSGTPESCRKSSRALKMLYDLIDGLRPYWPMCERLANATKELLTVHQKLYEQDMNTQPYISYQSFDSGTSQDVKMNYDNRPPAISRSPSSHSSSSITMSPNPIKSSSQPPLSSLLGTTTASSEPPIVPPYHDQQQYLHDSFKNSNSYLVPSTPPSSGDQNQLQRYPDQQRQQTQDQPSGLAFNWNRGSEIDFNSLEFLYDTGLFGQVVFDVNSDSNTIQPSLNYPASHSIYQPILSSQPYISQQTSSIQTSTPTPPSSAPNASAFHPLSAQQKQSSSSSYNPSKSLWN